MAFPRQTQQVFLEAHLAAFTYFGGVFQILRFDNLSAAIKRVLRGRRRVETDRFVALRSHFLFAGEFCMPGKEGAHEKGGVEGGLGRFRRNHLVSVPAAEDYASLNRWLLDECARNDRRTPEGKAETIGALWQHEKDLLLGLPAGVFDTAEVSTPRVDKMGRVCVGTNHYSVPIRLAHLLVEARLHALRLELRHEGKMVATHVRLQGTHGERLDLDHYLELLLDRPGALARSRPLRQARERGQWPEEYDRLWRALRERWGDAKGTRELVKVLMLHRHERGDLVHIAVGLALEYGCYDAGAICTLLRQLVTGDRKGPPARETCGPGRRLASTSAYRDNARTAPEDRATLRSNPSAGRCLCGRGRHAGPPTLPPATRGGENGDRTGPLYPKGPRRNNFRTEGAEPQLCRFRAGADVLLVPQARAGATQAANRCPNAKLFLRGP